MNDLNWDDLRFFLAVARGGTVATAGEQLAVSYTTVSRRIQQLESQLETALFDRTPNGYKLTEAGQAIVERAEQMEDTMLSISRDLFGRDTCPCGRLRVTMPEPIASELIGPYLSEFQQAYPRIELDLIAGSEKLDIDAREADIAIRATNEPPDNLIGDNVAQIEFAVYGSSEYLRRHTDINSPDVRYICLPFDREVKPRWVSATCPDASYGYTANSFPLIISGVRQHQGLALLPCFSGDADPLLERVETPYQHPPIGLWILSHSDYRNTVRVKLFRQFYGKKLRELRSLIEGECAGKAHSEITI